jgi:hypothetical protein
MAYASHELWLHPLSTSHAADAFGLMAVSYEEPSRVTRFDRKLVYPQIGIV